MKGALRARAAIVLALAVAFAAPACGGGTTDAASPPPATTPPATTPSPTGQVGGGPMFPPPGFRCGTWSGGASHASEWGPAGPKVVAVRTGAHGTYDRFVLEFDGTVPTYVVRRHTTTFTQTSGQTVTVAGSGAVLVKVVPQDWMAYAGPASLTPGLPMLREARLVENFEGVMQWGLGTNGAPCMRVSVLGSPPRLVVDVATLPAM
ncbi:MAG TPA: hypothetical protein VGH10_12055 [Actinomycetota bacterium]